jgi:hypothetical protein
VIRSQRSLPRRNRNTSFLISQETRITNLFNPQTFIQPHPYIDSTRSTAFHRQYQSLFSRQIATSSRSNPTIKKNLSEISSGSWFRSIIVNKCPPRALDIFIHSNGRPRATLRSLYSIELRWFRWCWCTKWRKSANCSASSGRCRLFLSSRLSQSFRPQPLQKNREQRIVFQSGSDWHPLLIIESSDMRLPLSADDLQPCLIRLEQSRNLSEYSTLTYLSFGRF